MTRTRIAKVARTLAPGGVEVGFVMVDACGVEVG